MIRTRVVAPALWFSRQALLQCYSPSHVASIAAFHYKDIMKHDLQTDGGVSLLLRAVPGGYAQGVTPDMMAKLIAAVSQRLNGVGLPQAEVGADGVDRLKVEVTGTNALEELRAVLGSHYHMEIVEGSDDPPEVGTTIVTDRDVAPGTEAPAGKIWHTVLTDEDVDPARVSLLPGNLAGPDVRIGFTPEGAEKLADFTSANLRKYVPIVLDKQVISAPLIIEPLNGGEAAVSAKRAAEALALFVQLKYGPLPLQLEEIEAKVLPWSSR